MRIDQHGGAELSRKGHDVASRQVCTRDVGKVDGNTAPWLRDLDRMLVRLQAANARTQPLWQDLDLLANFEAPIEQSSGHNRAKARQTKDAVNRQPRTSNVLPLLRCVKHLLNLRQQFGQSLPIIGRDGNDRGMGQRGRQQVFRDLLTHQFQPFFVYEVGFGQDNYATLHAQQIKNSQVLARLWHNPLVGGNHQQSRINAADTGKHILDEALMARHVDDTHLAPAWQFEPGKAKIDRHAAFFFFRQAIRIDARQRLDEG